MIPSTDDDIRAAVRARYGTIATKTHAESGASCCAGEGSNCDAALGYAPEELASVPAGANLGLGCGNPGALAALRAGETVLDLGAGAGFDALLSARRVGPDGHVIGVDMTPEMVAKARANAQKAGFTNVEFRHGEIERLPVADASIDVVLSNCVVNLSPDKGSVFREAFRVLKPGGRLAIADVVRTAALPERLAEDVTALTGCVAGAASPQEIRRLLEEAGFEQIHLTTVPQDRNPVRDWLPGSGVEAFVASAAIEAVKPAGASCCGPSCCPPASNPSTERA